MTIQNVYKATTEFGGEVAKSGFSRVCLQCGSKWASESDWYRDTQMVVDTPKRRHTLSIERFRGMVEEEPRLYTTEHRERVCDCGNRMLTLGEDAGMSSVEVEDGSFPMLSEIEYSNGINSGSPKLKTLVQAVLKKNRDERRLALEGGISDE